MRSRNECIAFYNEVASEANDKLDALIKAAESGDETGTNLALGTLVAQSAQLVRGDGIRVELLLDIRDAVTTWIAGDLSARSTAQQYRNTAVDVIVKLLRGIDKNLERLEVRGRP